MVNCRCCSPGSVVTPAIVTAFAAVLGQLATAAAKAASGS